MPTNKQENGFSYIEVLIAIIILTVGILAALTAISAAMVWEREAEQRNVARQITSSTLESIFATRDLRGTNPLSNWDVVANNTTATPNGIFLSGWRPVREDSGIDGIHGTADDACDTGIYCQSGAYSNMSRIVVGFERQVEITNLTEATSSEVKRKRVDVTVRYFAGQAQRTESVSTIIADLPFNR